MKRKILEVIGEKGGVLGSLAKAHAADPGKSEKLISYLFEQSHSLYFLEVFGTETILDIISYRNAKNRELFQSVYGSA
jgi:hypothetical protein